MPIGATIDLTEEEKLKLAEDLESRIPNLRSRRKSLEDLWERNHSAWRGVHTRSFFKSDTFNHFIPAARRVVERFVIRAAQMLMPSSEFFEVYPADEFGDEAGKKAESVRAYMIYLFRKKIKTYSMLKQLLRCYQLYARAITKTGIRIEREGSTRTVWPTMRVVDPFVFYVWPETATDIDQAQLVVEDNLMPWQTYKEMMDRGLTDKIEQKDLTKPAWPTHITERLAKGGFSNPDELMGEQVSQTAQGSLPFEEDKDKPVPLQNFVFLSEVWQRHGTAWWMVWLVWNLSGGKPRIVRVSKKPVFRSIYRMAVNREIPGEQYTTAQMDDVEPIQVLLNDQINLTLEGQATNFAPPTIIDPDMVSRASSLVFRPRAKWLVKPEGVKTLEFPDTTRQGYLGIQFTMGLMDQFSGSSPLAEGQPTRNLPRAGFAVSSLLNLSLADIRDAAQMLEDNVLTPSLGDIYRITVEVIPQSQIFRIPGTQNFRPRRFTTKELTGDFEFTWVGSLQSQDFQVRSQRLIGLLDVIGTMIEPLQRDLQVQGKKIEWVQLFKRIWREGIGERGADSIIGDLTPQENERIMLRELQEAQAAAAGRGGALPAPAGGGGVDEQTAAALEELAGTAGGREELEF